MKKKVLFYIMILALVLFFVPTGPGGVKVQAATKASKVYKARAKKARKNLCTKVKKFMTPGYANPSAKVISYKIKKHFMICRVAGSMGDGAYEERIKVNLKTGKCHVLEDMVSLPEYFKIKVK